MDNLALVLDNITLTENKKKLNLIYQSILSSDSKIVLDACISLRKLVSTGTEPPLDDVVEIGFISILLDLLFSSDSQIQNESCWILTNIVSGSSEHVSAFIEEGGLNCLLSILSTPDIRLYEQTIWALGNIAGDSSIFRDLILDTDILPLFINSLETCKELTTKRLLVWTVSNLCRGKPKPDFRKIGNVLPALKHIITVEMDEEVLIDALWALSYISDTTNDEIYQIIQSGITPSIVKYLDSPKLNLKVPALRSFGNLATGDNKTTLYMISLNVLPILKSLISFADNEDILKETVWTISNIVACGPKIIQLSIDFFEPLANILPTSSTAVKKEILWCLSNIVDGGDPAQIDYIMLDLHCFKMLCEMIVTLRNNLDSEYELMLSTLRNVFKFSKKDHYYSMITKYKVIQIYQGADDNYYNESIAEILQELRSMMSQHHN